MAKYSPMMQQYVDIKQEHQDCILFFRLGDFYEMFMEDAEEASRLLGIALTGRDAGPAGRVPMCGVPYHAADSYLAKLIMQGCKVAICEQVEDPSTAKGLVERRVVRIVTPGSVLDADMLEGDRSNYLAALAQSTTHHALAAVELSTGEVLVETYAKADKTRLIDDFLRLAPAELVLPPELEADEAMQRLAQLAGVSSTTTLDAEHFTLTAAQACFTRQYQQAPAPELSAVGLQALGAALHYLHQVQQHELPHLRLPRQLHSTGIMYIDATTRRNLELLETCGSKARRGRCSRF